MYGTTRRQVFENDLRIITPRRHEMELWQDQVFQGLILGNMYKRPLLLKAMYFLSAGFSLRQTARLAGLKWLN